MIKNSIKKLLLIVKDLKAAYPHKEFTLDGRLVGDIGEVLAEKTYQIKLLHGLAKFYDAVCTDGTKRNVQIKATMKNHLGFPCDHVPEYYLGIRITNEGKIEEVFNGPGKIIWNKLAHKKPNKINMFRVSITMPKKLNDQVPAELRIPKRNR